MSGRSTNSPLYKSSSNNSDLGFLSLIGGPIAIGTSIFSAFGNMLGKSAEEAKRKKAVGTFIEELYKVMPGEHELLTEIDAIKDMYNSGGIDSLNSTALSLTSVANPEQYQAATMGKMIGERNKVIAGAVDKISDQRLEIGTKIAGLKGEAEGIGSSEIGNFFEGLFAGGSAGLDIFSTLDSIEQQRKKTKWLEGWKA